MQVELTSGAFDLSTPKIVGIINVTPDSFYPAARTPQLDEALRRAERLIADGADIVEVGGEKAGPGTAVSADEEQRRVVPVVQAVSRRFNVPVAVDTYKPATARAALAAGAQIVNSIDGFQDANLRRAVADAGATVVIMHIQGRPRVANPMPHYQDVVSEVREFLAAQAERCVDEGIDRSRIVVDPGPGFGKSTSHDLELMQRLDEIASLPYPVMLAASRKDFIASVVDGPPGDRLPASLALAAWGVKQGVSLIRTHDVHATKRVCQMAAAVQQPYAIAEA